MSKILICSFSGGKTSAFMTYQMFLNNTEYDKILVVFANTGKEREETLQFVDKCDKMWGWNVIWIEAVVDSTRGNGTRHKVVSFETASRKGEPFEEVIRKYGIPNKKFPHCTRELKEQPIKSLLNELGINRYDMAIGIRSDEMDRINFERADRKQLIYPLATIIPTSQQVVNDFWLSMPFSLQLEPHQGNCDCCWKKSHKKLKAIARESPHLFEWWKEMQLKYGNVNPRNGTVPDKSYQFYREGKTVDDILRSDEIEFPGCSDSCEAFN